MLIRPAVTHAVRVLRVQPGSPLLASDDASCDLYVDFTGVVVAVTRAE